MSTLSARLQLTLPDPLDSMALGDDVLSANYDNIDLNCHCRVVSSLASVTNPFNGLHVRDTSTNKNYVRYNGEWLEFKSSQSQGASVEGFKNSNSFNGAINVNSETHLVTCTISGAVAGNRYLVIAIVSMVQNVGSEFDWGLRLRHGAGGALNTSSTLAYTYYQDIYDISRPYNFVTTVIPSASGTYSFGVFGVRTSGPTDAITNNLDSSNSRVIVYGYNGI